MPPPISMLLLNLALAAEPVVDLDPVPTALSRWGAELGHAVCVEMAPLDGAMHAGVPFDLYRSLASELRTPEPPFADRRAFLDAVLERWHANGWSRYDVVELPECALVQAVATRNRDTGAWVPWTPFLDTVIAAPAGDLTRQDALRHLEAEMARRGHRLIGTEPPPGGVRCAMPGGPATAREVVRQILACGPPSDLVYSLRTDGVRWGLGFRRSGQHFTGGVR